MEVTYLTSEINSVFGIGYGGWAVKFTLYERYSWVKGFLNMTSNFDWHALRAYIDSLNYLVESPAISNVVAAFIKTNFSSTSNFQETSNLWDVFNQFLIGIDKNPDFFAFKVNSKVCNDWEGDDFPLNLYNIADPSGIGKNSSPSWDYSLIFGF